MGTAGWSGISQIFRSPLSVPAQPDGHLVMAIRLAQAEEQVEVVERTAWVAGCRVLYRPLGEPDAFGSDPSVPGDGSEHPDHRGRLSERHRSVRTALR
jgi:hypothetical protein